MITILFLLSLFGRAQQHDAHPPDAGKPATLMTGLGRLHHPIATRSAEAQRFFDQGLTLVYGFNHDEAVRSFRRAAELDPPRRCRTGASRWRWGPTSTSTSIPIASRRHTTRRSARGPRASAPANERAYVDALVKRYSNDPKADLKALAVQYKDAMRDLVAQYPDDLDAATLYAESLMDLHPWQLWSADGKPTEGTDGDRRRARVGAAPRRDAHRRQPLLHPRRRGVAHAGPRAGQREAARDAGAGRRPSRPHAGAHLHAHGQLRGRGDEQREGGRRRSRLHQGDRRRRRLPVDVLQPQPRLPRVGGDDVGPVQGSEEGGRPGRRQRDADDRARCRCSSRSARRRCTCCSASRGGTT